MNKTSYLLRKHSATILTVISAGGVIATTVLAVKATPKATKLLLNAELEKGDKLTPVETVKAAWKPYIPAAVTGFSTIACIFGANYLNTKKQASLMSAYALLDSSFRTYRDKVKLLHDENVENTVMQEIVRSKFDKREIGKDKKLFFDYQSMQFFESTFEDVMRAEEEFMEVFETRGYACLNEFYDLLGLPYVEYGYQLGWFVVEDNDPYNCHEFAFHHEEVTIDDDLECCIITTSMPPSYDSIF